MMSVIMSAPALILLIMVVGSEAHGVKICKANQKESWSYNGRNGPHFWGKHYANCNGTNQSPINIDTSKVIPDDTLGALSTLNYDVPIASAKIANNGHTVKLIPTDEVVRSIKDGGLPGQYNLGQIHFHWGSCTCRGSEHRVNRKRYAMEMHLVHLNDVNEIAVLAVFFEESHYDNPSFEPFVLALNNTRYKGDHTTLNSALDLMSLLPESLDRFYRYSGSLTTPGCGEGVTWTVFPRTLSIGAAQIQVFRLLNSTPPSESHHCRLVDNYRPVRPLNGRQVIFAREG